MNECGTTVELLDLEEDEDDEEDGVGDDEQFE